MTIDMQDYFDKTVAHLSSMKGPSYQKDSPYCAYLGVDGSRCAVGVHIPDGHPALDFLGSVSELAFFFPELADIAWPNSQSGLDLAQDLQEAHDDVLNWDDRGFCNFEALEKIADEYDLEYEMPNRVSNG